jgi:uncharacterized protein with gpF-like domain
MIIYQTIKPTQQAAIAQKATQNQIIKDMAATMQDMASSGEAVTPDNLRLRDYSNEDIMLFGADAAHLARKLAVKAVRV